MRALLSAAGRSFLKAAVGAFVLYIYGLAGAPTLHETFAIAAAASVAAVVAGLRAIQAYVPKLTLQSLLGLGVFYGGIVDSFVRGFVGALIAGLIGVLATPDVHTLAAVTGAAVLGALLAGLQAAEGLLTKGVSPVASVGVKEPPNP